MRLVSLSPLPPCTPSTDNWTWICSRHPHTKPKTIDGIWGYGRSKLGNILFTKELTRRLEGDGDPGSSRIYVNCFFPGNIVTEQWGAWNDLFGKVVGVVMRAVFAVILGQSLEDGAATALYLATSHEVRKQDQRGQYFIPIAKPYWPTKISCDQKLARDVWVSRFFILRRWESIIDGLSLRIGLMRKQSRHLGPIGRTKLVMVWSNLQCPMDAVVRIRQTNRWYLEVSYRSFKYKNSSFLQRQSHCVGRRIRHDYDNT